MQNILYKDILPIPKSYSENLKVLIDKVLKKDPELRPSITELLELKIVKDKFHEYKCYDKNKEETASNTPNNNNSFNNNSSFNNNINLNRVASEDKFNPMNSNLINNKSSQVNIEIEMHFEQRKRAETTHNKRKISSRVINDTTHIHPQKKIFPQVRV